MPQGAPDHPFKTQGFQTLSVLPKINVTVAAQRALPKAAAAIESWTDGGKCVSRVAPQAGSGTHVLPLLAAVAATACFQVGAAFAKSLFAAVGVEGAATLRLGLGAIILLILTRPSGRPWRKPASLLPLLILGVAMAAVIFMFYMAIARLPLGIAISLQFLGPLGLAICLSHRVLDLVWAGFAAAGVWGLVGTGSAASSIDPVGVAYALGAAVGWATYILCGRAAGAAFGRATPALAVSLAALIILPVGLEHAGAALFSLQLLPLAILVAIFSTALPFSLELYAMPRMPARTFAVFTSLEPAFGALFGFLVLGEVLVPSQLLGITAVVTAACGAAWTSRTRPTASATNEHGNGN